VKKILTFMFVIGLALAACVAMVLLQAGGFSAREDPTAFEAFVARAARRLAIPGDASTAVNPLAPTPEVLAEARAHFADHCAICHANDGSGNTTIGVNLYPKAPDMREIETQSLTDGELFFVITNGIRLSGMPAFGSGTAEDDEGSWGLVHFIRRLPSITDDELAEMRKMNPVTRSQLAEEEMRRRFLAGESEVNRGHDHAH
jgi:mono/diheme cytochrome c family protein